MNIQEAIVEIRKELSGLYTHDEATEILSILLDTKRWRLLQNPLKPLSVEEMQRFQNAVPLLKKEKPIQQIVGKADFLGMEFVVNDRTLIPRPETEELVEWIVKAHTGKTDFSIVDIGTGTGCIPISLKKNFPTASVFGCDVSEDALEVARLNSTNLKLDVTFQHKNILNATLDGMFDIIVSNPPYIAQSEANLMERNVLEYEPHLALFVPDEDPLLFYRRIAYLATQHLNDGGSLYFEINALYGKETADLLESFGFSGIEIKQDMQGKDRFVRGKRPNQLLG